jgi:glycosyltransferase involved in cell wall biosynthesis
MSMRIAHVTATFPPYCGGTGNVCYHNARELARRGHDVHVFTASMPHAPENELCDGFTVHRLRPLLRVGNAPVLPALLGVLSGFDVIHLHYPFILGAEMVRLASLRHRIPLLISFHNDLIGDGARAQVFALYQRLSARLTIRGAARLCAVSLDHYGSSLLRRSLAEQQLHTVELPNGIDIDHFRPTGSKAQLRERYGIPAEAKLVLFVAALDRAHHFKGLDRLLQAFQRLPHDTRLLIVGDGDLRRDYEAQARQLGIADRVVFAGAIAHRDTPEFFHGAEVCVLPSSPPESFGLVLIESLACGTPVVASNIPGVRTVVDHGQDGLLVEPGDIAALARAMQQLLADAALRCAMGACGRAKVEARYGWEQIGTRLQAIYQQVLGDSEVHVNPYVRGAS